MRVGLKARLAILLAAAVSTSANRCSILFPDDDDYSVQGSWKVVAVDGVDLSPGFPHRVEGSGWAIASGSLTFSGKQEGSVLAEWVLTNEQGVYQPGQNGAGSFWYDGEPDGTIEVRAYDQVLAGTVDILDEPPIVSPQDTMRMDSVVRIKGQNYRLALTLKRCSTSPCVSRI